MSLMLISQFWVDVIVYARYVVLGIALLSAITIIVAVLLQNSNSGADSITGASYTQESYYSKNRGSTIDEKLSKFTKWASLVIAVCIVLYYLSLIPISATIS